VAFVINFKRMLGYYRFLEHHFQFNINSHLLFDATSCAVKKVSLNTVKTTWLYTVASLNKWERFLICMWKQFYYHRSTFHQGLLGALQAMFWGWQVEMYYDFYSLSSGPVQKHLHCNHFCYTSRHDLVQTCNVSMVTTKEIYWKLLLKRINNLIVFV
jgi:hypothetical protein